MSEPTSKKEFIDFLFYEVGKQSSPIEFAFAYVKKGGDRAWSKWRPYFDIQGDDKFISKINNRTILDIEIVLDIDPGKDETEGEIKARYNALIRRLNKYKLKYKAYYTGSRGYHIHLIFNELRTLSKEKRESFKEYIIDKFGCDLAKKSDKCMIALENTAHWKTGNPKKLIDKKEGTNKINDLLDEFNNFQEEKEHKEMVVKFIFDDNKIKRIKLFPFLKLNDHTAGFGIFLPKDKDIYKNEIHIGTEQVQVPVIITSNRELFEVGKAFESAHNIKFKIVPCEDNYQRRWSLKSIERYLTKKYDVIDGYELLSMIKEQYNKFLYFFGESWYWVHALWDLGTYFFLLSKYYPLMEIRGMSGTAKSKIMTVSRMMSFNATEEMTNPSEPTLFRETHENRPTKYIDEAEKLFTVTKGKIEADDRAELINSGYKYSGTVPRQEKIGQRYKTVYFNTYSPTMVASINGLFGATEERAIIHTTIKPPQGDQRGKMEPNEDDPVFQEIRDLCYVFALQNWKRVDDLYNRFDVETSLRDRNLNLWKMILVLAKIINEDLYNEVKEFAEKISNIKSFDGLSETSTQYKILKIVYELLLEGHERILVKDIQSRYPDEYAPSPKTIARYIDKTGFLECKQRFENGTGYVIDVKTFRAIISTICPMMLTSVSDDQTTLEKPEAVEVEEIQDEAQSGLKDFSVVEQIIKMRINDSDRIVSVQDVVSDAKKKGISEVYCDDVLDGLKKRGDIYEPKSGFIAKL